MNRRRSALLAVALATSGVAAPAFADGPAPMPANGPTKTITLASWGLGSIDELAWARVGLVLEAEPKLVVYHLDKARPAFAGGPGAALPTPAATASAAPELKDGRFVVSDFRSGNADRLGGFFNGFAKAPASASIAIDDAPGGHALTFDYKRPPGTFAGFWVHLFDSRRAPADRVYLDARGVAWLTFEVRGEAGDEPVRVQLADAAWERREDSVPIADVAALVPARRITNVWQRAWLPLASVADAPARADRKIDLARLASLVFVIDPEGHGDRAGRVQIRDLVLTSEQVAPPAGVEAAPATAKPAPEKKAMWLWETAALIASPPAIDRLVETCKAFGFTDLYVQIPYVDPAAVSGEPGARRHWSERWDEAGMRALITRLHAADVRVSALDGAPWYARRSWHDRVVMTVAHVADYNRKAPKAARFAGVRFDIEPYLLPEWQGRGRESVLVDYLALLDAIAPVAHAGGLDFAVDIPFWFDAADETTGLPAASVAGQPALDAILDRVDEIGVMDYRTTAYGADGVIAHGAGELAAAAAKGKRVMIGLESVPLPDERIVTLEARATVAKDTGGLVVEPLPDRQARLTWLAPGVPTGPLPPGARLLVPRDSLLVPADKLTFARRGRAALEDTMRLARPELAAQPSFAGFVLHSYESLHPWFPVAPLAEVPR